MKIALTLHQEFLFATDGEDFRNPKLGENADNKGL